MSEAFGLGPSELGQVSKLRCLAERGCDGAAGFNPRMTVWLVAVER